MDHLLKTMKEYKNLKKQDIQDIFIKTNQKKHDIVYDIILLMILTLIQHDMAYGDFKDLPKRTASDKVLRDKAFHIDKKASMVYIFLIKSSDGTVTLTDKYAC